MDGGSPDAGDDASATSSNDAPGDTDDGDGDADGDATDGGDTDGDATETDGSGDNGADSGDAEGSSDGGMAACTLDDDSGCPPGCALDTFEGHTYAFCAGGSDFDNYRSWAQAQAECESIYGNLVRIESAAEDSFLQTSPANAVVNPESAWIGASDGAGKNEGTWTWHGDAEPFFIGDHEDGAANPAGTYVGWGASEPNDGGAGEDCGALWFSVWIDLPCGNVTPYICEFS